jgi:hypothetical protein
MQLTPGYTPLMLSPNPVPLQPAAALLFHPLLLAHCLLALLLPLPLLACQGPVQLGDSLVQ